MRQDFYDLTILIRTQNGTTITDSEKGLIDIDTTIFFRTFYDLIVYAEEFITLFYDTNYTSNSMIFIFRPLPLEMQKIILSIRNMFKYETQYNLLNGTYIPALENYPINILNGIYVYFKSLRELIIRLSETNRLKIDDQTLLNINDMFREYTSIINKIKEQEEINNAPLV